ncbi:MAG: OmpH family outer membrane protein [Treponema sp.]|nr:OmpH family outer membrane protein [Treponema sp.]
MFKRFSAFLLLSLICIAGVYSQSITRFALVDLPKVYTAFFRDSKAVREFEERSSKVQAEIDKLTREIQDMRSRHANAVLADNQTEALRLENLIYRRSEFLRDYYQTKTAELEDQRNRLMQSSSFLDQVYDEIRYIAESEGYTMVLNMKNNPGIVWYSPTIDITDKLISNLQTRNR